MCFTFMSLLIELFFLVSPEPNESGMLKVECGQNGLSATPDQHTTLLPSVTTVPPIQWSYADETTDELTENEIITGNTI